MTIGAQPCDLMRGLGFHGKIKVKRPVRHSLETVEWNFVNNDEMSVVCFFRKRAKVTHIKSV